MRFVGVWIPLLVLAAGCSVGQGTGDVKSDALFAHDCWGTPPSAQSPTVAQGAPYDMQPNFFAANPYRSTLQIRVQKGTDLTQFSDGLAVLIDDIDTIRAAIAGASADGGAPDGGSDAGSADAGAGSGAEDAAGAAFFTSTVVLAMNRSPFDELRPGSSTIE